MKITKAFIPALFAVSMISLPANAQVSPLSDAEIVAVCISAADDSCSLLVAQLVAQLRASGLSAADIDGRLSGLTVALAEGAGGTTGIVAQQIGAALRVAASEVSDPDLQEAIIQIAAAEEAGETFDTAALGQVASPN